MEVIACACATCTFCTTTIVQNVSLHIIDRATGSDVTPKGFPRVRACPTGSWGFPPLFRVFSDMLCSTPRLRSQCGISKSTFDSLSHSIEGQSAFTQDCD
jgi:hypothetical protein